ncbi:flagellin [Geobacter sp. SVR]|uniref:flagellin n=1 Tax=Geobacter sp. SVR TaxID=2495594 RepID=UPI00143EF926|nr:flagellin [Geobacter sp. SVR]BCS55984.1 flagellin [Geobacter sp. SVR]GCF84747.1 flagellin [Geobacter sp. SVR]
MALSDISLTAGMRNNLLSLSQTSKGITTTQNRLSTGKKVNTPLDNPTNYFAAQNAVARANDLDTRKDGMSEAVQMLSAATAGIKGITSLIQSAQGVAAAALGTADTVERSAYSATYSTLLSQISQLASDSGYKGTNFLTNGSQTVEFGQRTNAATLQVTGFDATSSGLSLGTVSSTDWTSTAQISTASGQLESALSTLRTQSAALSSNLSVVTTRQDFTDSMISTLTTGADNLTLADMNQEGANMLMLQTRQNLGISSLSMASQAAQAVLRLF